MNRLRILATLSGLPFSNCSTVMGPKVGDTRTYMFVGVLYSLTGVAGMASEPCAICSPDVDVWVRIRVSIGSLAGGVVLVVCLGMICRPSF